MLDWYEVNNCQHAHCPEGCEKPQPVQVGDRLLCSRCMYERGVEVEMIPCHPDTCD